MSVREIKAFCIASLIYATTLIFIPQSICYVLIVIWGLGVWVKSLGEGKLSNSDIFLLLFTGISTVIFYIGRGDAVDTVSKSNGVVPYSIFLFAAIYFSKKIVNPKILKYILLLIAFETFLGCIQRIIGVPYFFKPSDLGETAFGSTDLFYYNRVYGLSAGTSIFAYKIFIGILLTYFLNLSKRDKILLYGLLALGTFATFNRTAIVATICFILIVQLPIIWKGRLRVKILIFLIAIVILILVIQNFGYIEMQFFRGKGVDYSGRTFIYADYLEFIKKHPIFGNFFVKRWVVLENGFPYHAHNSYLETYANMGVLFASFLFVFIFSKIRRKNFKYIFPILIYSGYQYGILWGISFLDIIFFYFLLNPDFLRSSFFRNFVRMD